MTDERDGGYLTGSRVFLVLTESIRQPDGGWKHSCGEEIMSANVTLSHRMGSIMPNAGDGSVTTLNVPYCPKCERQPVSGTYQHNGSWSIDAYA